MTSQPTRVRSIDNGNSIVHLFASQRIRPTYSSEILNRRRMELMTGHPAQIVRHIKGAGNQSIPANVQQLTP
jgi:hypothetical protein